MRNKNNSRGKSIKNKNNSYKNNNSKKEESIQDKIKPELKKIIRKILKFQIIKALIISIKRNRRKKIRVNHQWRLTKNINLKNMLNIKLNSNKN
jgi:hypothetical protein